MAVTARKKRRPQLLSSTRPRNIKSTPTLSSRATRATVCAYHILRKQISSALAKRDDAEVERLTGLIKEAGGIRKYQQASIQGQSAQRGGDTSKVLMDWLHDLQEKNATEAEMKRKPRLLEVGALRADNACSKSGVFEVERIDLHSQHPDINEQDFMARPIPCSADIHHEGFDLVSLSLVINFVGDPLERGEMLRRVRDFLRPSVDHGYDTCPAMFLVLPAPCVNNSRYLDEDRLESIMQSLGYTKRKSKISAKLVYYLWKYHGMEKSKPKILKKKEVRTGKSRNNFAIVLA